MILLRGCTLLRNSVSLKCITNSNIRAISSCNLTKLSVNKGTNNQFTEILPSSIPSLYFHSIGRGRSYCSQSDSKVVNFLLADIGEGIQEVVVREWFVKEGDVVHQFDNVCEVQSDKASVTITSRYDGVVHKLHYKVDETAYVGKPLVDISVKEDGDSMAIGAEVGEQEAIAVEQEEVATEAVQLPTLGESVACDKKVLAIPMVRRFAKDNNVDISQVTGSGRDGRVIKEDVMKFIAEKQGKTFPSRPKSVSSPHAAAAPPPPPPVPSQPAPQQKKSAVLPQSLPVVFAKDRTEPLKGIQKIMVKTMTEALKIPHFLYCDEVDLTSMVSLRKEMKAHASLYGISFSYLPYFVKAASMALLHYPVLNASVDKDCQNITYKASHNIGLAMDTAQGLLVPNIKGVQGMTVLEVAAEINRLHSLGLKGALTPSDLSHGTFTLSNIGSIGGTYAAPVILPPEVAIGAIGKIQVLPRFNSTGGVIPAHIMQVSWSADHRVIEGATMARFSNKWKELLENPSLMTLHMK